MTKKKRLMSATQVLLLVLIIGLIAVGSIFILVLWQGNQPPESSVTDENGDEQQVSETIPLDSPVLVSMSAGIITFDSGEAFVFIPAYALDKPGQVVLTQREPDLLSEVGEPGWRRPYVVNVEYQDSEGVSITNVVIKKPIEVCFVLDDDLWSKYQHGTRMRVERYAGTQDPPAWLQLPTFFYENRQQLCGRTSHLSIFALAVKDVVITEPTTTDTPGIYSPP